MNERVSVFIDGSNLERAVLKSFSKRVRPECLVEKLTEGRRLMKAYYYEAPLLPQVNRDSFDAQQRFFERLRSNPYFEIRLGRRVERRRTYECPKCGERSPIQTWEQKGVDSLIVFDLVTLATRNAYDTAILIAGDSDFVTPVLEVRMLGKVVENAFTSYAWAQQLKMVADNAILLNEESLKECWQE